MSVALEMVAHWPPRCESLEQCTERLHRYLRELGELHPALRRWYEKGRSRKDALKKPVALDRDSLRRILDAGRNRGDFDGRVFEDLGFHRGLWNGGRAGSAVSLSLTCGRYWEEGSNRVHLGGEAFDHGMAPDTALGLVRATVRAWSPEWMGICSRQAGSKLECGLEHPFVDWIFFHRRRRRAPLPSPSRVAFELDGGECVVVQEEPVAFDDPQQRARSEAVAKVLGL